MASWTVKRDGPCSKCGTLLRAGEPAVWVRGANRMECLQCPTLPASPADADDGPSPSSIDTGVAGASAQREYERRLANREEANRARWGDRVGGWITRFGTVPQSTDAWGIGAQGERVLAAAIAEAPGSIALHDRRVPGTKGNIDHIVVAPAGVFVIDAKKLEGLIAVRDYGGLFRTDLRLTVNGRNRSHLAIAVEWQVNVVIDALDYGGLILPYVVQGILCFVGGQWPLIRRPRTFGTVRLESDRSIASVLGEPVVNAPDDIDRIARFLVGMFPPK